MSLTKLWIVALVLAVGAAGSGVGWFYRASADEPASAPAKADAPKEAGPAATGNVRLHEVSLKLRTRADAFPGFDDPKTTFQEALEGLQNLFDLPTLNVNEAAFKETGVNDVLSLPVAEKPIAKMKGVTIDSVLRKVLSRIPSPSPATYVVRGDHIEITTEQAVRSEAGVADDMPLYPLIHGKRSEATLEEWLRALAEVTDCNVMLDPRAELPRGKLSATLTNVPLDTAVRLLADMAGARMVHVGNVLYVTSVENAKAIEAERTEAENQGKPVPPPAFPGGRRGGAPAGA